MTAPAIEFRNVTKVYGDKVVVDGVSFEVAPGAFFSLLGPSGCGKTTLLRMLAGFIRPDEGRVFVGGRDVTGLPPNRRPVNTVFQNYALFPHLTVRENIAFGLRIARRPRDEIGAAVDRMLELIQMEEHADKKPALISGGQKQRVAVARALVNRPQVLLLDEPLAALDLKLRQRMLLELDLIHDEVGITFIYVTHDQSEAMGVSARVAVMNAGRIEQIGSPAEIYDAPRSGFVAAFIGDTNFFSGRVAARAEPEYVELALEHLGRIVCFNDRQAQPGDRVNLSLRPEKIRIHKEARAAAPGERLNQVAGTVEDLVYMGSHTKYWVRVDGVRVEIFHPHQRYQLDERPPTWRDPVHLSWLADDGIMLEQFTSADATLRAAPPEEIGEEPGAG